MSEVTLEGYSKSRVCPSGSSSSARNDQVSLDRNLDLMAAVSAGCNLLAILCWHAVRSASMRRCFSLLLAPASGSFGPSNPRKPRSMETSMSSENLSMTLKTFDSEVPPLKIRCSPSRVAGTIP